MLGNANSQTGFGRCHVDSYGAGSDCLEDTLWAKVAVLNLIRHTNDRKDHIRLLGKSGWRIIPGCSTSQEWLSFGFGSIVDIEGVPSLQEVLSHRQAHQAGTNEANRSICYHKTKSIDYIDRIAR
jgi:hypothetical protein